MRDVEPIGVDMLVGSGEVSWSAAMTVPELSPVLFAALEHTRSATCITTADLDAPGPEVVYVNPAYCAMIGLAREEVVGQTPRLMQGPLTDRAVLDRLRADLTAGRGFAGETVNYRADGTPFFISWSIDPVRDASGTITHFVATQEDVTSRVRAENLLAAEKELDEALTAALVSGAGSVAARQRIVDQIVDGASRIAIVGSASVHVVDTDEQAAVEGGEDKGGETVSLSFTQPESSLRAEIRISGLDEHELPLLDRVGLADYSQRAGAVASALVEYQRQRTTALRLQRRLLPTAELSAPGFSIAARYSPGAAGLSVGGDWYDVVASEERVVFSVGDVTGRGVDAAALMGRLRLLARVSLERDADVGDTLRLLDEFCGEEKNLATMLVVEFDRTSDAARIWSAGHLPPIVIAPDGVWIPDLEVDPPLGYLATAFSRWVEVDLPVGTGILMFTDGLVERRGEPVTDGLQRLRAAIQPGDSLEAVIDAGLSATSGAQSDDVAALALRRIG